MNNRSNYQTQLRKKKRNRAVLKSFLIIFLIVLTGGLLYGYSIMTKAQSAVEKSFETIDDSNDVPEMNIDPATENVSVLLLGIDDSDTRNQGDEGSRTDAIMLATFNANDRSVKLLSIPRDSLVYIPEVQRRDKINHAYSYGGTRATVETLQELLEVPIDYYVKMNFNAFIDVVDALDGIEVEVPYERIEKDENDGNSIHLKPGFQTLDGRHALALARTRKLDSDVDRGKRQQEIVQAMMKKVTSVSSVLKYGDVIEALGDNMKTNMTFKKMMSFVSYGKNGIPKIENVGIIGHDDWREYGYYYVLEEDSLEEVKEELQTHLGRTISE